jgi:glycerol-3-phosphate acyltransferase PlsY
LILWWLWPEPIIVAIQITITLLLFWRHRSNIRRLISGEEGRIRGPDETP